MQLTVGRVVHVMETLSEDETVCEAAIITKAPDANRVAHATVFPYNGAYAEAARRIVLRDAWHDPRECPNA
jgi:hypothetical protein